MPRSLAAIIHAANTALLVEDRRDAIAEFFTPDHRTHLTGRELGGGHGTIRKVLGMLRRAFPELEVEVEILLAGKDRVAWQRTLRGRHVGAYQGFPGTGRRLTWRDMFISRFQDGRIAEDWMITDLAEQLLRARKR